MGWASNWSATSLDESDYETDPNSTAPDASQVHEVVFKGDAARFVIALVGPSDATAQVVLWVYDDNAQAWIPWSPAIDLTTTEGVDYSAPAPIRGRVYTQLVATANAPTGLHVGYVAIA